MQVRPRRWQFIRTMARKTFATSGVLTDIGSFGGGFRLRGYRDPVLVSSADGVGTKLKVAFLAGIHSTVGEDLVNHCVNDTAVRGAVPLFPGLFRCRQARRARGGAGGFASRAAARRTAARAPIGGETAEMPGLYAPGEYDLPASSWAPWSVSACRREPKIRPGDVLIGLPSSGLHTNGYLLARQAAVRSGGTRPSTRLDELAGTIGDELPKLHRSWSEIPRALDDAGLLKGAAHITGGGITDNTPRILPKGLGVRIDLGSWPVLPIFEVLRKIGRIPEQDWRRTFNLGIGMILVVSQRKLAEAAKLLDTLRETWYPIGAVIPARKEKSRLRIEMSANNRLGILLSGRGSNFLAIADAIAAGRLDAEIAVVISTARTPRGSPSRGRVAGLPAVAIESKAWRARTTTGCSSRNSKSFRVDLGMPGRLHEASACRSSAASPCAS